MIEEMALPLIVFGLFFLVHIAFNFNYALEVRGEKR